MSTTREYIDKFLADAVSICERVDRAELEKAVDIVFDAWKKGGTVFCFGNGGSAGTATHLAADLMKCTITPNAPRLKALALSDNIPLVSALSNDDGWENVYTEQLMSLYRPGDVAIAISVHGGSGRDKAGAWSQNLMKGLQYVKDNGGKTIGFSGFDGGPMKQLADACIVAPANSTPLVEGFHVVFHHLLAFALAERMRRELGVVGVGRF